MGINTVRTVKRCKRRLVRALLDFFALIAKLCLIIVLPIYKKFIRARYLKLRSEILKFKKLALAAFADVKKASKRGLVSLISESLNVFCKGYKCYRKTIFTVLNYAAPAVAVLVFVLIVNGWFNQTFALSVSYNGKEIALIENQQVFNKAADMMMERIINENSSYELNRAPVFKLTTAKSKDDLCSAEELCNRLLIASDQEITQSVGLYIDGRFIGAVEEFDILTSALDSVLEKNRSGAKDEKVEFANDVQLVNGYYPKDAIVDIDALTCMITGERSPEFGQLMMINSQNQISNASLLNENHQPLLSVKVSHLEKYESIIPFSVKETSSLNHYVGYKKVTVTGKHGLEEVTDEVTYIDGKEVERKNISRVVLKAPVDEQITVGARKTSTKPANSRYSSVKGDGIVTGKFQRPIKGYACNSGFRTRRRPSHTGFDFACPRGTPIYAADGGVVESVVWNSGGYGLCIVIRHANGYSTLYAHCSQTYVVKGQSVSKGQVIAAVGSTGRSTGNHLHFEIRVNNTPVNPGPYLGMANPR